MDHPPKLRSIFDISDVFRRDSYERPRMRYSALCDHEVSTWHCAKLYMELIPTPAPPSTFATVQTPDLIMYLIGIAWHCGGSDDCTWARGVWRWKLGTEIRMNETRLRPEGRKKGQQSDYPAFPLFLCVLAPPNSSHNPSLVAFSLHQSRKSHRCRRLAVHRMGLTC